MSETPEPTIQEQFRTLGIKLDNDDPIIETHAIFQVVATKLQKQVDTSHEALLEGLENLLAGISQGNWEKRLTELQSILQDFDRKTKRNKKFLLIHSIYMFLCSSICLLVFLYFLFN